MAALRLLFHLLDQRLDLGPRGVAVTEVARGLEVAHDVGAAVVVVDGLQPGRHGAHRDRQDARELAGVDAVGPDVVVVAVAGVLTDEQGAHALGVLQVVAAADAVLRAPIAVGVAFGVDLPSNAGIAVIRVAT